MLATAWLDSDGRAQRRRRVECSAVSEDSVPYCMSESRVVLRFLPLGVLALLYHELHETWRFRGMIGIIFDL